MDSPLSPLPIILLAGPTGVGKTALSLELARRLRTDIVNADSMQVYRYLDIGTAKPTAEERRLVRHHLLDVVDPDQSFDAGRYLELAQPVIEVLHRREKVPIVVGGTGLYMKVLLRGICPGAPDDPQLRRQLMAEERQHGLSRLHEELQRVDPVLAGKIHGNDRQRILRALEVYRLTGRPLSFWHAQHRFARKRYPAVKIFLQRSRESLYQRIDERVHSMLAHGFVEEVRGLLEQGYHPGLKPMQSLGYRQLVQYLQGACDLPTAIREIQRDTRRYAKRQLTWFRGDAEFCWWDATRKPAVIDHVLRQVDQFLSASVNSP